MNVSVSPGLAVNPEIATAVALAEIPEVSIPPNEVVDVYALKSAANYVFEYKCVIMNFSGTLMSLTKRSRQSVVKKKKSWRALSNLLSQSRRRSQRQQKWTHLQ